jgi:hypothetical protein
MPMQNLEVGRELLPVVFAQCLVLNAEMVHNAAEVLQDELFPHAAILHTGCLLLSRTEQLWKGTFALNHACMYV